MTRRDVLQQGALAGAGVGAAALLAACGGSSGSNTTATSPAATPTGPQKHGGTLHVGIPTGSTSDTLDGLKPLVIIDFARQYQLYDHFMITNPNGVIENYITDEVTPNKTATEWTLRLRKGMEFHNGKSAGADDVIFTFQRALNPKTAAPAAGLLKFVDLKTLKKIDPLTVRFSTTRPFVMPYALARYELVLQPVGFDPKNPVGSGPFKASSFTPGQRSVFLANENYWGGRPFVDQLVIIDLSDDTARLNAMLGGTTDMMVSVPYASVPQVKSASGIKLVVNPTGAWFPLVFNVTAAPYNDVRVRQAMRLLADRKQMISAAYLGYGVLGNDLYGLYDPLYDHSIPQRTPDPEKAKSLLKAAGHSSSSFTLVTANLGVGNIQAGQVFAENAKSAGVNVTAKQVDLATWDNSFSKWPFTDSQWGYNGYAAQVLLADGPKPAYAETHFGDNDPEFAKLANELTGELDQTKQKQIADQMQQIQWDRGGYLVWSFQTLVDAASAKVTGYTADKTGWSFGSFNFRKVSFT